MNIKNLINNYITSKLFNSVKKSVIVYNEQILSKSNSKEDKIDFKSSAEKPRELGKNSWLHSADDFGKMENGRVL
jgi:hypothetical protein